MDHVVTITGRKQQNLTAGFFISYLSKTSIVPLFYITKNGRKFYFK
jgi:hypothetical protein